MARDDDDRRNPFWRWIMRMFLLKTWRGQEGERGEGISFLVPFRPDNDIRDETWAWLKEHYHFLLPGSEIVVGVDDGCDPFSKSMAVNDAASRARGDVFVIMDADCLISPGVIEECAKKIRRARGPIRGRRRLRHHDEDLDLGRRHLWFVPYRRFWRLNKFFSRIIIDSDPRRDVRIDEPPDESLLDSWTGVSSGHHWGALILIMPREAFELVGGMDPRFRSWGSEDVSFMWAVDTLYGKHRTSDNPVFHLWHPRHGGDTHVTRFWKGGTAGQNNALAMRFRAALGDRARMRRLVDEGFAEDRDE